MVTEAAMKQVDAPRIPSRAPDARGSIGPAEVPTIVAIGPFDDYADAGRLAAAFCTVRRHCRAQLALLGGGAHSATVVRYAAVHGAESSVRVLGNLSDSGWVHAVAAADLVLLSTSSPTSALLAVLAAGRPVVAPVSAVTAQLVVPAIAGLVYAPGDECAMAAALLRLATTPELRQGMGDRARNVQGRHRRELLPRNGSEVHSNH